MTNAGKRYIFSQQLNDFGNKAEANYSLAKSTMRYLCSGIFDETLPDEQLKKNILTGKYRLHWFAFTHWVALIRPCIKQSRDLSDYEDLRELLCRLALELRNYRFEGSISLKDVILQEIESTWPEIMYIVSGVMQFRQDDNQNDWNFDNRKSLP